MMYKFKGFTIELKSVEKLCEISNLMGNFHVCMIYTLLYSYTVFI